MGNDQSFTPENYNLQTRQQSLDRMPELKHRSSLDMSLHNYQLK